MGIAVCTGIIIYSWINQDPIVDFLDSSLFKSGLVWLGFVEIIMLFDSLFVFSISLCILRFLPDWEYWGKIAAIIGVCLLLFSFILGFISYNLETNWMRYAGMVTQSTGAYMMLYKDIIEQRIPKISKIWRLLGSLLLFAGLFLFVWSISLQS